MPPAVDLDQAQAAGAERLERVGGAQLRDGGAASPAARITDVPAGTVTGRPSMVIVTVRPRGGRACRGRSRAPGSSPEVLPSGAARSAPASPRVGRPSRRASRTVISSQRSSTSSEVGVAVAAVADPVDDLDAAGRADPARRALAAGLRRRTPSRSAPASHVDGVVEHDDPAVADHAAPCDRRRPRSRAPRPAAGGDVGPAGRPPAPRAPVGRCAVPPMSRRARAAWSEGRPTRPPRATLPASWKIMRAARLGPPAAPYAAPPSARIHRHRREVSALLTRSACRTGPRAPGSAAWRHHPAPPSRLSSIAVSSPQM